MIYNPSTKAWTVSEDGALKEIVQDACMVNIADDDNAENLVITGGTERKIQFVSLERFLPHEIIFHSG